MTLFNSLSLPLSLLSHSVVSFYETRLNSKKVPCLYVADVWRGIHQQWQHESTLQCDCFMAGNSDALWAAQPGKRLWNERVHTGRTFDTCFQIGFILLNKNMKTSRRKKENVSGFSCTTRVKTSAHFTKFHDSRLLFFFFFPNMLPPSSNWTELKSFQLETELHSLQIK